MIVSWNFYVRRKRLNIKEWLTRKNIKDYNDLVKVTKKLGIEPPTEENVAKYFDVPEKNKNDKKIKKPAAKRATKSTTKRATKSTAKRATKSTVKRATKSTVKSDTSTVDKNKDASNRDTQQDEATKQTSEAPPKRKRRTRKKRQPAKEENQ